MCTGSRVARAAALALGALAPGGGGLGAAGAGLKRPLRGVAAWVLPLVSELPYPARRAPRRFLVVCAARKRCGACLGVPAARHGFFRARRGCARRGAVLCIAPARGWRACTGSGAPRASALALGTLAPVGGGLGAACAAGPRLPRRVGRIMRPLTRFCRLSAPNSGSSSCAYPPQPRRPSAGVCASAARRVARAAWWPRQRKRVMHAGRAPAAAARVALHACTVHGARPSPTLGAAAVS